MFIKLRLPITSPSNSPNGSPKTPTSLPNSLSSSLTLTNPNTMTLTPAPLIEEPTSIISNRYSNKEFLYENETTQVSNKVGKPIFPLTMLGYDPKKALFISSGKGIEFEENLESPTEISKNSQPEYLILHETFNTNPNPSNKIKALQNVAQVIYNNQNGVEQDSISSHAKQMVYDFLKTIHISSNLNIQKLSQLFGKPESIQQELTQNKALAKLVVNDINYSDKEHSESLRDSIQRDLKNNPNYIKEYVQKPNILDLFGISDQNQQAELAITAIAFIEKNANRKRLI